jgi:4-amino-4-deoxy-L-arabinose transferase-like glycosyltransferase
MTPLAERVLGPFERLYDSLVDSSRRERAALGLLLALTALYTIFGAVSNGSTSVHWDVGELVGWSRAPAWGYKHPPMSAWVAIVWFSVFPVADWSAYLLAMVVSGAAIWIGWRLMGDWLDAERRALGLAMLLLIPLHTFMALKFNANTVMMPFWAAATLCFLRSVRDRRPVQAALAGAAGAGAMLGKYWSVNLVGGLGLAALLDRRRAAYFKSMAPWITLATLVLLFLPHIVWLKTGGSVATGFAQSIQEDNASRTRTLSYLLGAIAYVVVPLLLFATLRPTRAALRDTLRPADDDRRLAAMAFVFPLLLPAVLNLLLPTRLTGVWTIPNWILLPVVLLGSSQLVMRRRVGVVAIALAVMIPVLAVIASPFIASSAHRKPRFPQSHFQPIGEETQRRWRAATTAPLRLLGGDDGITPGAAFYAADKPVVLRRGPMDDRATERIARDGIAVICLPDDIECLAYLDDVAKRWTSRREEMSLTRTYRGVVGPARKYVLLVVPPTG